MPKTANFKAFSTVNFVQNPRFRDERGEIFAARQRGVTKSREDDTYLYYNIINNYCKSACFMV